MRPKRVFIDLWGGIFDDFVTRSVAMKQVLGEFGLPMPAFSDFYRDMTELISNGIPPAGIFKKYGVPINPVFAQQMFDEHFLQLVGDVRPFPGIPELIGTLRRRGTTVVLITKNDRPLYQELINTFGMNHALSIRVTSMCVSDGIRFAWRVRSNQFGPRAEPRECAFLSGNPWSLADALDTGVKTFALHRNPDIIPDDLIRNANPTVWIRSFPIGPIEV